MAAGQRPNPYCAFKCDKERRRALISRDVRYVGIALVTAFSSIAAYLDWGLISAFLR